MKKIIFICVVALLVIASLVVWRIYHEKQLTAEYEEARELNERNSGAAAASIGHRNTEQTDEAAEQMGLPVFNGELKLSDMEDVEE